MDPWERMLAAPSTESPGRSLEVEDRRASVAGIPDFELADLHWDSESSRGNDLDSCVSRPNVDQLEDNRQVRTFWTCSIPTLWSQDSR